MDITPKHQLPTKAVIITAVVIVSVVIAVAVAVVIIVTGKEEPSSGIGYSKDAQVILTQEEMQAAIDAERENSGGGVALLYKNDAYSYDGVNFACYIVNSPFNSLDMFLAIYADMDFTDELFLSQLVPPGSGFNTLKLNRPLELGDHEVYVAMTQVEIDEETGEEVISQQIFHTMDFHVVEE